MRRTIMSRKLALACLSLLITSACAAPPPRELQDARAAYRRAASGEAARVNPAQLEAARSTLALAEQTYDDEGSDSFKTRDRAYVATRKAELAEVQARI